MAELQEYLQCACAELLRTPMNVWITQIVTNKFVRYGDTIFKKNMVSLLSEGSD